MNNAAGSPNKGLYLRELTDNVIPFWEKNCIDREYGGYFNSLDRDGSIYDTEKFMWIQWRTVWMFSELYFKLRQNERWLEMAAYGYEFLGRMTDPADEVLAGWLKRQGIEVTE